MNLSSLQPTIVWEIFEEISAIPRETSNEEKIRVWVVNWVEKHKIHYQEDAVGNILLKVPASSTRERDPSILLQAHMDMVCVKEKDSTHDFRKDPIVPFIEGEWVTAQGTTLGADNGIGMALALAILLDKTLNHPELYVLLTVAEEGPLTGAKNLSLDYLPSPYIINLDSENLTNIPIGSVGLRFLFARTHLNYIEKDLLSGYRIVMKGLRGGHSGINVRKPHLTSIREIFLLLTQIESAKIPYHIGIIDGGDLINNIPTQTSCEIFFPELYLTQIEVLIKTWKKSFQTQYIQKIEPLLSISFDLIPPSSQKMLSRPDTNLLLTTINSLPEGILTYLPNYPDEIETATQLGYIHFSADHQEIGGTMRSMNEQDMDEYEQLFTRLAQQLKGEMTIEASLVPWPPKWDSKLLKVAKFHYNNILGKELTPILLHAGMETGLIANLKPEAEIISMAASIEMMHSPKERVLVSSVTELYQVLREILQDQTLN